MNLQLVEQLKQQAVPVNQLCRVLAVSRSGCYTARKRDQAQPALCQANVHLKAAFAASSGAYVCISAIVDACFSVIVDGLSAPSCTRRDARKRGFNGSQTSG